MPSTPTNLKSLDVLAANNSEPLVGVIDDVIRRRRSPPSTAKSGLGSILVSFFQTRVRPAIGESADTSPRKKRAAGDETALLELEKRYGLVSKSGKDEEAIQWRLDRLAKAIRPDTEEEDAE